MLPDEFCKKCGQQETEYGRSILEIPGINFDDTLNLCFKCWVDQMPSSNERLHEENKRLREYWDGEQERFKKWYDDRYTGWPKPGRVFHLILWSIIPGIIGGAIGAMIIAGIISIFSQSTLEEILAAEASVPALHGAVGVCVCVYFVVKWYTTREEKSFFTNNFGREVVGEVDGGE